MIFYVAANIKSSLGWREYARFFVGNDEEIATQLFESLSGDTQVVKFLRLDLLQKGDAADLLRGSLYCTASELGENCTVITRELFKLANLEAKFWLF